MKKTIPLAASSLFLAFAVFLIGQKARPASLVDQWEEVEEATKKAAEMMAEAENFIFVGILLLLLLVVLRLFFRMTEIMTTMRRVALCCLVFGCVVLRCR